MLVFIDESGDTGFKMNAGSSRYFTIALVIFYDHAEAIRCDQGIEVLKQQLDWMSYHEFHFNHNSDTIRQIFLRAISSYKFFYYAVVIDKTNYQLLGYPCTNKQYFYHYTCGLVFSYVKDILVNATVIIDESGNQEFCRRLTKYLRDMFNHKNKHLIKKVKMQRSASNNLIQLADYIAGVINRSVQQPTKIGVNYRQLVRRHEVLVEILPK